MSHHQAQLGFETNEPLAYPFKDRTPFHTGENIFYMVETTVYRKNKINLKDYDYQRDIQNRTLMAQFTEADVELLEEIICSPTKILLTTLSSQIDKTVPEVLTALERLAPTALFKQDGDVLLIDKEVRKYFETELVRFEDNFTPGMDFLHSLLKKVSLDVLLSWYPIPRTSNSIFQSLIDKYFRKPQTFQRHLTELDLEDPVLNGIKTDLSLAPDHKLYAANIKEKYQLTDTAFEEAVLHLEFNFICCLCYEKKGAVWVETVTFFQEWKDYLSFMRESRPKEIEQLDQIQSIRTEDFAFTRDLSTLLALALKKKIYIELDHKERWVFERQTLSLVSECYHGFNLATEEAQEWFLDYFCRMVQKILLVKLATVSERQLIPADHAEEWLAFSIDKLALNLYKLTLKHYPFSEFPSEICSERIIHEVEKSIARIIDSSWVFFEDFMKGAIVPIGEENKMQLKQTGRHWKYVRPSYSAAEQALIKKVIYDWFFEAGIVKTGVYQGKECLSITSFGKTVFG
ncbi:MAG: hypothetical protein AAF443_04920 [Chlamydiota bacterium]